MRRFRRGVEHREHGPQRAFQQSRFGLTRASTRKPMSEASSDFAMSAASMSREMAPSSCPAVTQRAKKPSMSFNMRFNAR
jgi:hypothetical protein